MERPCRLAVVISSVCRQGIKKKNHTKIFFKWHFMIVEGLFGVESVSLVAGLANVVSCVLLCLFPLRPPDLSLSLSLSLSFSLPSTLSSELHFVFNWHKYIVLQSSSQYLTGSPTNSCWFLPLPNATRSFP